jgi:hypothetical protein
MKGGWLHTDDCGTAAKAGAPVPELLGPLGGLASTKYSGNTLASSSLPKVPLTSEAERCLSRYWNWRRCLASGPEVIEIEPKDHEVFRRVHVGRIRMDAASSAVSFDGFFDEDDGIGFPVRLPICPITRKPYGFFQRIRRPILAYGR